MVSEESQGHPHSSGPLFGVLLSVGVGQDLSWVKNLIIWSVNKQVKSENVYGQLFSDRKKFKVNIFRLWTGFGAGVPDSVLICLKREQWVTDRGQKIRNCF